MPILSSLGGGSAKGFGFTKGKAPSIITYLLVAGGGGGGGGGFGGGDRATDQASHKLVSVGEMG